jgi:tetratricopeptide (TPR) repeat protein
MGPGSVDLYFGRYKPAEARESKYLHNWVVQLAAETGIIGVALAVGFVGLLLWQARRSNNVSERALVIMVIVFVFDALLQLSFSHREMMAVFGLCCGALLASGNDIWAGGTTPRKRYNNALALVAGMALSLAILALVVPRLVALDYRQRANDAIESKEPAEAIRLLRNSQQWEPNHPAAYLSLAQLEEQGGQLSSELMLVEKAVRLQPESAAGRAALSHVQVRLGNYEEALASMKEALARYPANPNYNGQMAELLLAYAEVEAGSGQLAEIEAAKRNRTLAVDYARKAAQYSPGVPGAEHWPAFYHKLQKSGDN